VYNYNYSDNDDILVEKENIGYSLTENKQSYEEANQKNSKLSRTMSLNNTSSERV